MNEPWHRITKGGLVTWCVDNGYFREFKVLDIYASTRFKDEGNPSVQVALLEPIDPPLFFAHVLEQEYAEQASDITIEVPLTLLVPVVNQTVH